jgi:hypothetical protein
MSRFNTWKDTEDNYWWPKVARHDQSYILLLVDHPVLRASKFIRIEVLNFLIGRTTIFAFDLEELSNLQRLFGQRYCSIISELRLGYGCFKDPTQVLAALEISSQLYFTNARIMAVRPVVDLADPDKAEAVYALNLHRRIPHLRWLGEKR